MDAETQASCTCLQQPAGAIGGIGRKNNIGNFTLHTTDESYLQLYVPEYKYYLYIWLQMCAKLNYQFSAFSR